MQPRLGLIGWLLLALVTMRPAWAAAQNPRGEDLAVIVHPAMPVSGISLGTLRQVFLGDQQFWRGDARVTLFVQAQGSSERAALLNQIYRMQEPEFKHYWIAKTFRAEVASGPKIVSSNALARRLTGAIPGAVALIPASEVDSTVKVLRVDGRLPGDPGYPIHQGTR